jgi:hypothetical protein
MKNSLILFLSTYKNGDKTKEDEMGGACGTYD